MENHPFIRWETPSAAPSGTVDRILRLRELERLVGLKKTAIYDRIRCGAFPAPVRLSATVSGWLLSEVQAWIQAQQQARDAGEDA